MFELVRLLPGLCLDIQCLELILERPHLLLVTAFQGVCECLGRRESPGAELLICRDEGGKVAWSLQLREVCLSLLDALGDAAIPRRHLVRRPPWIASLI